MSESQYLAMALQQMGQPQAQASTQSGPNFSAMQKMVQDRQAWEAANPGQSYAAHGLGQMGENLMGAPGRVVANLRGLGQIPGQAASGLQALVQRFSGGGLPTTTNI